MTRFFDALPVPLGGSLILSAQPASQGPLVQAVHAYRAAGARLVVSLLPEGEAIDLGLHALGAACTSRCATPRWPMHASAKAYANGQELFVAAQGMPENIFSAAWSLDSGVPPAPVWETP